ncbi:pheST operon leader peptide PheM [Moellerella wisconsensis]
MKTLIFRFFFYFSA